MRVVVLAFALFAFAAPVCAQEVRGLEEARAAFDRYDYQEAFVRYSAMEGTPAEAEALFHLSIIHEGGYGVVESDDAVALTLLQRAAAAEYPPALTRLGMRYYEGEGVTHSRPEGIRLWRRAAELNHVGAIYSLGVYYLFIHGVERDVAEGALWMRRAAEAGHADAQFDLGRLYERGEGVEANAGEAFAWMRKAAVQGQSSARVRMVQYYFNGTGVARDVVRAEMWALIAERTSDGVSPEGRAVLNAQLSNEQRAEAARLADQCMAAPATSC